MKNALAERVNTLGVGSILKLDVKVNESPHRSKLRYVLRQMKL